MNIMVDQPDSLPPKTQPHTPSSSLNISSPSSSVFSRGHSSKGSGSNVSIASSPIPRDSFDLYASRLGKVTEEPQEKEELATDDIKDDMDEDDSYNRYFRADSENYTACERPSVDHDSWSGQPDLKRQRSSHYPSSSVSNRLSSRFNSISRRWRNRSGAGRQLSIITHVSAPVSRTGSAASSVMSPALTAISRYESYLPPSPTRTANEGSFHGSDAHSLLDVPQQEEEPVQATTPLLPPIFSELDKTNSPINSPLQSPSIAPTHVGLKSRLSTDHPVAPSLPSPPLSSKPSIISIRQRSRANTTTNPQLGEVPSLQMLDDAEDLWASKLGHADFSIHPEPYLPGVVDLDSYTEFRANWTQARTNYAKHLARTIEHYGSTSRVFNLTEEKWNLIDQSWKSHNEALSKMLAPLLARSKEADGAMHDVTPADAVLEKPVTRIIIPAIDDKSGKFPELGDSDIVGPMEVVAPRSASMQRSPPLSPTSPRKRNLLKFLQDMFGRQ